MKNGKRILAVRIKRMLDTDPDTSHLGQYSDKATSEFSIDRAHSEDCQSVEVNHREIVDKLERVRDHIISWYGIGDEVTSFAEDDIYQAQSDAQECDCGRGEWNRREYRYFNPSFNYVGKDGKPSGGLTPEEVRKYTRQDYDRMEALDRGQWWYIGIRAEAAVILNAQTTHDGKPYGLSQEVTSGGLWGIESDSEESYFAEVAKDELAALRDELLAVGFSRRAIATAFKNVKEVSE